MSRPLFEAGDNKYSLVSAVVKSGYENNLFEKRIINEGLAKGLVKDAIQFVAAGAAEYGLAATGAGAPAAPAVETAVDALFAVDSIVGAVSAVKDAAASAGNFSNLLNNSLNVAKGNMNNLGELYDKIKNIVINALKVLGKNATDQIDKLVEALKDKIEDIVSKLADALVEGIKLVIPDATIGAAVSAAIRTLISKLAENSYSLFSKVVKAAGKYSNFITDPDVAPEAISDLLKTLSEMCSKMSEKLKSTSALKSLVMGPQGIILKKLGEGGLNKVSALIDEKSGTVVDLVKSVTGTVIPSLVACLAIFQMLLKGEYKEGSSENKSEKSVSPAKENSPEAAKNAQAESFYRTRKNIDLLNEWAVTGHKRYYGVK